jgi:hypothetical protein
MGIARFIAFICATAVLLGPSLAFAEKRVALVIGNGSYQGRSARQSNERRQGHFWHAAIRRLRQRGAL